MRASASSLRGGAGARGAAGGVSLRTVALLAVAVIGGVVVGWRVLAGRSLLSVRGGANAGGIVGGGVVGGGGAGVGGAANSALAAAGPRLLVMTSSNCGEFAVKDWVSRAHSGATGAAAAADADYDLVVFDYSETGACAALVPQHARTRVVRAPRTFKWPAVFRMLTDASLAAPPADGSPGLALGPSLLASHDYFLLSDDDVDYLVPGTEGVGGVADAGGAAATDEASAGGTAAGGDRQYNGPAGVLALAAACRALGWHLCQPALSARSAVNMDVTAFSPGGHFARDTGFVEQMAPLFCRAALMQMLPYFPGLTHGWGIDALWSDASADVLGLPVGVIDAVQIDHLRKSGVSNLYKRVGGIEKAEAERAAFRARFRIGDAVFARMQAGNAGAGRRVAAPEASGGEARAAAA